MAAVVDPKFEIDDYLVAARYLGVSIEHVLETHNHADHVSGHGRLAAATGASIHVHRLAAAEYAHEPFEDGWELELGRVRVRALHTPGHRPEHTAFALTDTARSSEPVGGAHRGHAVRRRRRPAGPGRRRRARARRTSFARCNERLLTLPAEVEVWPGPPRRVAVRRLRDGPQGVVHARLRARQQRDARREGRRSLQTTARLPDLGPQPPNFERIVEINRGPLVREGVEGHPLAPRQVEQKRAEGALVVDVRTDLQFDDAHVPGAVCITMLRAGFGSKLAWVARPDEEIVLVGRDDDDARRAIELAAAVGVRRIGGYLHGGMTSWREERRAGAAHRAHHGPRAARPDGGGRPAAAARRARRVRMARRPHPGTRCTCPTTTSTTCLRSIDPIPPVAAVCESGPRSAVAASLLQRHGVGEVLHVVDGGVGTWRERGWPMRRAAEPAASSVRPRGRVGHTRRALSTLSRIGSQSRQGHQLAPPTQPA